MHPVRITSWTINQKQPCAHVRHHPEGHGNCQRPRWIPHHRWTIFLGLNGQLLLVHIDRRVWVPSGEDLTAQRPNTEKNRRRAWASPQAAAGRVPSTRRTRIATREQPERPIVCFIELVQPGLQSDRASGLAGRNKAQAKPDGPSTISSLPKHLSIGTKIPPRIVPARKWASFGEGWQGKAIKSPRAQAFVPLSGRV